MKAMLNKLIKNLKEFIGADNELVDSTEIALNDRVASPFYGYFLISWLMLNWRLPYVAFFVGEEYIYEKTGLIRIEYLDTLAYFPTTFYEFMWFLLKSLVGPFFLTIVFFWFLFPISKSFYRKGLQNQISLKIVQLQELKKQTVEETELLRQESDKAKEEKRVEAESPEILWEREFNKLKKRGQLGHIDDIRRLIYDFNGEVGGFNMGISERKIENSTLAFAHVNGLIEYKETSNRIVSLTEKGKYFIRLYLEHVRLREALMGNKQLS